MRPLLKETLDMAARDYARDFFKPTVWSRSNPKVAIRGRDWAIQCMYNSDFKDEFEYVRSRIGPILDVFREGGAKEFEAATGDIFTPRHDDVFEELLAKKLAIKPNGERIKGAVGTVVVGQRIVGYREVVKTSRDGRTYNVLRPIKEDIHIGDPDLQSVGAAYNMAAVVAQAMLDAIDDEVNEGTASGFIRIVSGTQPADPDAALTGTVLAELEGAATFFGAAADDADGTASLTAAAISDDTSANATGTATHFRLASANSSLVSLDDKIDGDAGTGSEDLVLNTAAIQSGANVSITSYVINLDQGTSAT